MKIWDKRLDEIDKEILIENFYSINDMLTKYRCIKDVEKYLKYHMYN